jgi:hypothetical protein
VTTDPATPESAATWRRWGRRVQPFTFFVSYRRQDTAPIALLLKNEIEKLQFVRVSVDVEEMKPGERFPES